MSPLIEFVEISEEGFKSRTNGSLKYLHLKYFGGADAVPHVYKSLPRVRPPHFRYGIEDSL